MLFNTVASGSAANPRHAFLPLLLFFMAESQAQNANPDIETDPLSGSAAGTTELTLTGEDQQQTTLPSRENTSRAYDEYMEHEVYSEAVTTAKVLVTLDLQENKDHTESLMKLAEAQSKNGNHAEAVANYESVIAIRSENDFLAKNLAKPYEQLGRAHLQCLIERVQDDDSELQCVIDQAQSSFDRAIHIYHVNEGPWTREQADSLRGQIDLQVLTVNELLKLGLNDETLKEILRSVRETDSVADNLFNTARKAIIYEHGQDVVDDKGYIHHPDILPAINERGKWLERSLRSQEAQKLYINSIKMLEDLRDQEIESLLLPETERIKAAQGLKQKQAEQQARLALTEQIDSITQRYDQMKVPQLEHVARTGQNGPGSNFIGEIIAAQKGLGITDPYLTKKMQDKKSNDALEERARILEESGQATPVDMAKAYVSTGDSLFADGKSFSHVQEYYQKAWQILREQGTEEEFNSLLGQPAIIRYEQPKHILSRKGADGGFKAGRSIGKNYDGVYTVSHIFTVLASGRLGNIELEEDKTNAPQSVSRTQYFVLSQIARARPKMNWETGEFEEQKVRFTRHWYGEDYVADNNPGQQAALATPEL